MHILSSRTKANREFACVRVESGGGAGRLRIICGVRREEEINEAKTTETGNF